MDFTQSSLLKMINFLYQNILRNFQLFFLRLGLSKTNYKNFKEYKQVQNEKFKNTIYVFEDYIIKINSEKMTIVTKDLFKEESWPFSTMEFEIINFKNNMLVGKGKPPFSKQIININLNNKKAAIWNSKQDKKNIKFDISCKLYEGSDDSTLRSILKMINN